MNECSGQHRARLNLLGVALAAALGGCATMQPPPPAAPVVEAVVQAAPPAAPMIWAVPRSKPARLAAEQAARADTSHTVVVKLAPSSLPWPVRGQIVRLFGAQPSGARNDGLDIAAAQGSPVVAVGEGVVTYAGGDLPGYGNMVLVSHPDGYTSVYAHNQRLLASVGAQVRRGQQIATVGPTGDGGESRLHFQLRAGQRPVDPEPYLEPLPTVMASLAVDEPPLGAR